MLIVFATHAKCQSIYELTAAAAYGKPIRQATKPKCVCLCVHYGKWHEMWHTKFYLLNSSNHANVCASERRQKQKKKNNGNKYMEKALTRNPCLGIYNAYIYIREHYAILCTFYYGCRN